MKGVANMTQWTGCEDWELQRILIAVIIRKFVLGPYLSILIVTYWYLLSPYNKGVPYLFYLAYLSYL